MDRAIARAKSVATPGAQSFIDLREILTNLKFTSEQRALFDDHMKTYSRDLLPAANEFAAAHIRRPIDGNDEAIHKAASKIAALNVRTLEMLRTRELTPKHRGNGGTVNHGQNVPIICAHPHFCASLCSMRTLLQGLHMFAHNLHMECTPCS